jgi:hypothetical protein
MTTRITPTDMFGSPRDDDKPPAERHPMPGQVLMKVNRVDGEYDETTDERVVADLRNANVITSTVERSSWEPPRHKPVLDIDLPVKVVPSSTPGNFHLYIDHAMPWEHYVKLLAVLGEIGILEPGYVSASVERGHTAVRLPWVRKQPQGENPHD